MKNFSTLCLCIFAPEKYETNFSTLCLLGIVWLWFGGVATAEGLRFIQNKGQWEQEVLFRAEIPGGLF